MLGYTSGSTRERCGVSDELSELRRLVLGGVVTSPESLPEESSSSGSPDMRSAEKSEQDDTRARTLEALYETVTKMLSELNEFRPFEVATVRSRLSVALEHMYDSRLDFRGILAGCSTSLIMYLVVPVILLRLFAPGHTLAAYGILYIATLLSGVLVWFIGGLIFGIFAAVGISEWYEEKFINSMVGVLWAWNERNSLWRWNESDEDEEVNSGETGMIAEGVPSVWS
jgi:hypothetical protein